MSKFVYMNQANKGCKKGVYGDWVLLHMRKECFLMQGRSKLQPRGDGLFEILAKINDNVYSLELPGKYNVCAISNVVDISLCCE